MYHCLLHRCRREAEAMVTTTRSERQADLYRQLPVDSGCYSRICLFPLARSLQRALWSWCWWPAGCRFGRHRKRSPLWCLLHHWFHRWLHQRKSAVLQRRHALPLVCLRGGGRPNAAKGQVRRSEWRVQAATWAHEADLAGISYLGTIAMWRSGKAPIAGIATVYHPYLSDR